MQMGESRIPVDKSGVLSASIKLKLARRHSKPELLDKRKVLPTTLEDIDKVIDSLCSISRQQSQSKDHA